MKRALLVGIDDYDELRPLAGCVNDVRALLPLLARNDDDTVNFACETLDTGQGDQVTRDELQAQLKRLLAPGADVALLYFAGHGVADKYDVALASSDATEGTPGVKMSEVLAMAADSPVNEINIVLDCCFSGAAGGLPQTGAAGAFLRPGLSIVTASRSDQESTETDDDRGLFSWHLGAALDGGAADVRGNVTLGSIWGYLSECFGPWDQRPTLKANVDRSHVLRGCSPTVGDDVLRDLAAWFPAPDHEFPLDPSHEDTAEPRDADHEAVFKKLQRCCAAKLVEPVDEEHMYYAAMNAKACRLTPLGRHYRHMAEAELL